MFVSVFYNLHKPDGYFGKTNKNRTEQNITFDLNIFFIRKYLQIQG